MYIHTNKQTHTHTEEKREGERERGRERNIVINRFQGEHFATE